MKPANDINVDYKDLVRRGYNQCASDYDHARRQQIEPALANLADCLDDRSTILDIGCGAGIPVASELAQHFAVIGIDISQAMIELAQVNAPTASFINNDVMFVMVLG